MTIGIYKVNRLMKRRVTNINYSLSENETTLLFFTRTENGRLRDFNYIYQN